VWPGIVQARTQLVLEFLEGERGDVFAKDFPLEGLKSAPFLACHDEPRAGAKSSLRLTIARLPRCIVILLHHSLAQKNFHASDSRTMRREELPSDVLCGGSSLQGGAEASGCNFRVDDPGVGGRSVNASALHRIYVRLVVGNAS
jgi:hypothetical protein